MKLKDNEPACQNCKFFLQHYGLSDGWLHTIYCGHCIKPRIKHRRPDAKICDHFEPGKDPLDDFADKRYLSKKMVEYFVRTDLLTEIQSEIDKCKNEQ